MVVSANPTLKRGTFKPLRLLRGSLPAAYAVVLGLAMGSG